MGSGVSRFAGSGTLKRLAQSANLPLEIDDDISHDQLTDPGKVCDDTVEEDDGQGNQTIFRIVRVPFRVVFVSGNLKLRFRVTQSRQDGKINFMNVQEGRLITRLHADFDITPIPGINGEAESTDVLLDARIKAKQLPPPPFRSMVKGIMVSKIDQCMLDLMRYHGEGEDHEPQELGSSVEPVATASATVTASSQSPKASDMNRVAAGNRLTSHRPQSPLSESDVSEASQSPALSDTPPLAKPLRSSSPAPMASIDDKYL